MRFGVCFGCREFVEIYDVDSHLCVVCFDKKREKKGL